MSEIDDLIKEIKNKLLSSECDIVECLKKGRYIAKYFNDMEILNWIESELKGYTRVHLRDLPAYRKIKAGIYQDRIEQIPLGLEVLRRTSKDVKKQIDFPYPLSIEDVIIRSKETNDFCELTNYVDTPKYKGQINLLINISEFLKIIMELNLKLSDYIQEKAISMSNISEETPLMNIFNKFHEVAKHLELRYENRETLSIEDEYDAQDLLNALLHLDFTIVKKENYNPSFAGKDSRIDFFLRLNKIGIEVKNVRDKAHAKKIDKEIIDDKAKYSNNQDIKDLYFFIYDPNFFILNREEFVMDLEKDTPKQFDKVKIIIKPNLS